MSYKVTGEDDDCFHVSHKGGPAFKVSKGALGEHGTKKVQKMYKGGSVKQEASFISGRGEAKGYAGGGKKGSPLPVTEATWTPEGGESFTPPNTPSVEYASVAPGAPAPADATTVQGKEPSMIDTVVGAAGPLALMANHLPPTLLSGDSLTPKSSFDKRVEVDPATGKSKEVAYDSMDPSMNVSPTTPTPVQQAGVGGSGMEMPKAPSLPSLGGVEKAKRHEGDVEQQRADVEKNYGTQAAGIQGQGLTDMEALRKNHEDKVALGMAVRNKQRKEIDDYKVDPNRLLGNMDLGNKVLAGIGIMLGAAGSRGGTNKAMDILNKRIEQDIDAQKGELGKKQNRLKELTEEMGDERAAYAELRAEKWAGVQGKLNQLASTTMGPKAQVVADMAKAVGETQIAQNRLASDTLRYQADTARYDATVKAKLGASAKEAFLQMQGTPEAEQYLSEADQKLKVASPDHPGHMALLNGEGDRGAYTKTLLGQRAYNNGLDSIINMAQAASKWSPDDQAKMKGELTKLGITWSQSKGMGAYDQGTADALKLMNPDPLGFNLQSHAGVMDRLAKMKADSLQAGRDTANTYLQTRPGVMAGARVTPRK